MNILKPALTSDSRVFIAPKRASCANPYQYHNCMRAEGLDKSFGDITPIYCPHPTKAGQFVEIAAIEGGEGRWTSSLVGRLPIDYQSILAQLAVARCPFDAQIHFGKCVDPSDFNSYSMAWVLENVSITSYNVGTLGALGPDERGTIDETIAVSAENAYQIFKTYPYEFGTELTNLGPVVAMTYGNKFSCDASCQAPCQDFYGIKLPATPLGSLDIYIIYTNDGGLTWNQTVLPCSAAYASSVLASYNISSDGTNLYVTLNEVGGLGHLYVVPIDQVENGAITSTFFTLSSGFSVNTWASVVLDNQLWMANSGSISVFDRSTFTVSIVMPSTVLAAQIYAIDGIDSDNVLAGGQNGGLVVRQNGGNFKVVNFQVGGVAITAHIRAVKMKTQLEWLVGTDEGTLYCTTNGGKTFTLIADFNGCIVDMDFPTNSVGYAITRNPSEIWRTIDGGATWVKVEDKFDQLPVGTEFHEVAVCSENPNTFIIAGRIPNTSVASPCDINLLYAEGNTGTILVGRQ